MPLLVEPASPQDLDGVLGLVGDAGLPTAGIPDAFPAGYAVVRLAGEPIGVAGLEVHGAVGLLRSVAVRPSHRSTGIGRLLVEDRLRDARSKGLAGLYLLTTTAGNYFEKLGFTAASRAQAPAELQRSSEFASVCPSSAILLMYRLG